MNRIGLFLVLWSVGLARADDVIVVTAPPDVEIYRSQQVDLTQTDFNVPFGRFVAFVPRNTAAALTYQVSDEKLAHVLEIPVGQGHSGIVWDDATGTPKSHKFPGAKGPIGIFTAGVTAGTVTVNVWQNEKGPNKGPGIIAKFVLNIGGIPPPKPVDPKPVDPKPVDPIVIPQDAFRVLFAYETEDNLTAGQKGIINSTKIRKYLNEKTAKAADGRGEYRFWDKNMNVENAPKLWQDMWSASQPFVTPAKDKLPAVIIFNGVNGTYEPWPADEDKMLELLMKYGGK